MGQLTLVLTASDERQAGQFRARLEKRERLGLLGDIDAWRVVADPPGLRIGSGGSTIRVLRELASGGRVSEVLAGTRVLIIHGGGESRRMPAYAVCGKVFCPVPGDPVSALPLTLFDAQIEAYLHLPENPEGQVIIFAGDVLIRFEPHEADLSRPGLTGVSAMVSAEEASEHGVYGRIGTRGAVERFLQKPTVADMEREACLDRRGRAAVDLGIMSFTPAFADTLVAAARHLADRSGGDPSAVPLDFYTEIACALGSGTTFDEYVEVVRRYGASGLPRERLSELWDMLHGHQFHCSVASQCDFFHFGTSDDYLHSAQRLSHESRSSALQGWRLPLVFGCEFEEGRVHGQDAAVEACTGSGTISLGGRNLLVGAHIENQLRLRNGVCLDVLPGRTDQGEACFFHRLYGIDDTFKGSLKQGTCKFLNEPMNAWLERHGIDPTVVWPHVAEEDRSLWTARLFPAADSADPVDAALWMQETQAPRQVIDQWIAGPRRSMQEMSRLADGERFWRIREDIRRESVWRDPADSLNTPHALAAADVAYMLEADPDPGPALRALADACADAPGALARARLRHTLGSALKELEDGGIRAPAEVTLQLDAAPAPRPYGPDELKSAAFDAMRRTMVASAERGGDLPARAIAQDQIVWGRAPVRLDLAGGWTDTPPYTLEHGGAVVNAAVDLNGQPPIQVFGRISRQRHVRLGSIDLGLSETVTELDGLLDYQSPEGSFSVAKAGLALCGFSPDLGPWPRDVTLRQMLDRFGGGIELTTLCAVPKGSGLGTSSILGAVILATINRMLGVEVAEARLFHQVLVLEQMLTTGGGWQDQIGGAVGGIKLISTRPGMVPDPLIHWIPPELVCPTKHGGCNLLYYTGITRLAKNILANVVGRYLDRDREAVRVLDRLKVECGRVRDALGRRDAPELGAAVARVWELNKTLDPGSSNEEIEDLMQRIRPHSTGAKLLGAGGGGFLLILCPDAAASARCRADLESDPPNERARFFDFQVNERGLEVTVS